MYHLTHTPAYQKAFQNYLRYGFSMERKMKAREHATTHYIWRTRDDDKVRPSHAANNGKIFAWDNPPPAGNPGEDFGCRCRAESIGAEDGIQVDFIGHFYRGEGRTVTLSEIGYLAAVIEKSKGHGHVFDGVNKQVAGHARAVPSGLVADFFENSYSFHSVSFALGRSVVLGNYAGAVRKENDYLIIEATVNYRLFDTFTDPLDLRELLFSGSGLSEIPDWLLYLFQLSEVQRTTDLGGKNYSIVGQWQTALRGIIKP